MAKQPQDVYRNHSQVTFLFESMQSSVFDEEEKKKSQNKDTRVSLARLVYLTFLSVLCALFL